MVQNQYDLNYNGEKSNFKRSYRSSKPDPSPNNFLRVTMLVVH